MNEIEAFIFFFMIFAAIHSFMASDFFKNRMERYLKKNFRFYRFIYTVISFITFAPVMLTWMINSGSTPIIYSVPQTLHPLLYLIRLAGIGLFVYAAIQTDIFEFIGIRQLQNTMKGKNVLTTRGAYGIVRHPLYFGGIIVLLTMFRMTKLDAIAVTMISIYLVLGAFLEEKRLLVIFGEEYKNYQKKVSMLIPAKWLKSIIERI